MQFPDKECHFGIFFTNSGAFNTHLESDHKAEEGFQMGNGHAVKNQLVIKCIMKKEN